MALIWVDWKLVESTDRQSINLQSERTHAHTTKIGVCGDTSLTSTRKTSVKREKGERGGVEEKWT